MTTLGKRFEEALVYATNLHARQIRKGSNVPYISHLLGVASLVLEDGGNEDEAIAALLHDAVEDQGGHATLDVILQKYGPEVAAIVEGCTDAFGLPKPPWRKRKEEYIRHLGQASRSVRRVSLADKLHNARSIRFSLLKDGEALWDRFNGGKEGTLWYYQELVRVFLETGNDPMTQELQSCVSEILQFSNP